MGSGEAAPTSPTCWTELPVPRSLGTTGGAGEAGAARAPQQGAGSQG
jgi:hypothetical protein